LYDHTAKFLKGLKENGNTIITNVDVKHKAPGLQVNPPGAKPILTVFLFCPQVTD